MNEETKLKVKELYNVLTEKPKQILEIFNDFYGEDKVDMQGVLTLENLNNLIRNTRISYYMDDVIRSLNDGFYQVYSTYSFEQLPKDAQLELFNYLFTDSVKSKIVSYLSNDMFILVHFPHVTIKNEHDRFVDINHLYAKIWFKYDGTIKGKFGLNRSEYSYLHLKNNYMHSHMRSIPTWDFPYFESPCTGSGPINTTIFSLGINFDSSLWELFCLELSKFVQVESLAGVPYHHLENLHNSNCMFDPDKAPIVFSIKEYTRFTGTSLIQRFIEHFIRQRKLKFSYVNGSYSLGIPYLDYYVLVSNEFIRWYNDLFNSGLLTFTFNTLKSKGIITENIIDGGKIYLPENSNTSLTELYDGYVGKKVCTFKGEDVVITIVNPEEDENKNTVILLNPTISSYILTVIFRIINYKYGKSNTVDEEGNPISEKVKYF